MLEVRNLTKCYNRIPAVNEVSFVVRPHEVLGYLGPNGSGKSTTANMLTGLLEPTRGHIYFDGWKIQDRLIEYKRRLGYVPEEPHVYAHLSGQEYLQLVGRLRSLPEKLLNKKIAEFLHLLGLHPHRHALISSYSKGMRQKVLISAALLHDPDVLIFDEPLSGLDVTTALVFRDLVRALAQRGKMILYSSHVLEVVERICTRVIILQNGSIVADDSVEHLRDLMQLPSLGDIFAQLVLREDTETIAGNLVDVMALRA
jgi:ABC-2 type transport system ATP-binding protein